MIKFFSLIFNRYTDDIDLTKQPVPDAIQLIIQKEFDYLIASTDHRPIVEKLTVSLEQVSLPLIPQHGDFSVRNILYRESGDKVLIDWEDCNLLMLPLVDINMLRVSLAESWAGFCKDKDAEFNDLPLIQAISSLFFL